MRRLPGAVLDDMFLRRYLSAGVAFSPLFYELHCLLLSQGLILIDGVARLVLAA